ncbi:unnamed protein product [Heterobilharzia americana]|nr:unnamed protein product [Heterobilharzia americana]
MGQLTLSLRTSKSIQSYVRFVCKLPFELSLNSTIDKHKHFLLVAYKKEKNSHYKVFPQLAGSEKWEERYRKESHSLHCSSVRKAEGIMNIMIKLNNLEATSLISALSDNVSNIERNMSTLLVDERFLIGGCQHVQSLWLARLSGNWMSIFNTKAKVYLYQP